MTGAGNHLKASAKPVLIGTAWSRNHHDLTRSIMALTHGLTLCKENLSLLHAPFLLGLITGRGHDLLVHRSFHAGGHHRRLPRG